MEIDFKQITDLIAVVTGTEITELTIENGNEKITVKRGSANSIGHEPSFVAEATPPFNQTNEAPTISFEPKGEAFAERTVPVEKHDLVPVTAPMVGTFYRSSSPTAKPFVDVGDKIAVGQTVCIIEAMKLMNDMPSEVAGRVVKICVENGSTVEYGQQLFLVDPKA